MDGRPTGVDPACGTAGEDEAFLVERQENPGFEPLPGVGSERDAIRPGPV